MIEEYAVADRVRVLREAPAPSKEQANLVSAVSRQLAALHRAFDDYEESAYLVDEDSSKSKKKESEKKKKDTKSQHGRGGDSKSRSSKHPSSHTDAAGPPTAARKINANTARTLARTRGSMTRTNASTTRSIKVGNPAKYARSWASRSNTDKSSCQTWEALPAVHQRKVGAT
jgi:hypothetical protein